MSTIVLEKWQDPDDGFPTDRYFDQVVIALEDARIGVVESSREEYWSFVIKLDPAAYAAGPLAWATEGLWIGWHAAEESDPLTEIGDEAGFTGTGEGGPGWYYAPHSKPNTTADFVKDLEYADCKAPLHVLVDPAEVAAAVVALVRPAESDSGNAKRDLCWKQLNDYDNCHLWENHDGTCLATCGDCKEGRCHIPIRPPVPGVGDPTCGCARHADSIEAYRRGGR